MGSYHCTCDPHGDNAKCDRECCKPRREPVPKPHREDLGRALLALDYAERHVEELIERFDEGTRSHKLFKEQVASLARVADWIADQMERPGEHTGLEYRGG